MYPSNSFTKSTPSIAVAFFRPISLILLTCFLLLMCTGERGIQGAFGNPGANGAVGVTGDKGNQGPQGIKGILGRYKSSVHG